MVKTEDGPGGTPLTSFPAANRRPALFVGLYHNSEGKGPLHTTHCIPNRIGAAARWYPSHFRKKGDTKVAAPPEIVRYRANTAEIFSPR